MKEGTRFWRIDSKSNRVKQDFRFFGGTQTRISASVLIFLSFHLVVAVTGSVGCLVDHEFEMDGAALLRTVMVNIVRPGFAFNVNQHSS